MRSSFLLLALVGMASAQVWQQMPPAKPDELFEGIPKQLPKKNNALIRIPAKNPQQWSLILDDGTIFTEQTLLTKMDVNSIVNDVERYLELLAFAHEYNEWGINGPPTGFSITKARTPFVVKRKKRNIQKPINNQDMINMFVAVAKKFEMLQGQKKKRNVETPEAKAENLPVVEKKKAEDLVEMMKAIKEGMESGNAEIEIPKSMLDYFKIVWKSFLNAKNVGFGESMKKLATSLTGQVSESAKVTKEEEPKKKEADAKKDDEFAALVFNKDSKKKASALGSQKLKQFGKQMDLVRKTEHFAEIPDSFEKVYREGSFGGRNRGHPDPLVVARKRDVPPVPVPEIPSLTLKGKYHLVPKAWSQEEMENFYNAMVEGKKQKRALRADRVKA